MATFLEGVLAPPDAERRSALFEAARSLDRQLRDIRAAAEPLTRRLLPMESEMTRLLRGASILVFHMRQPASSRLLGNRPPAPLHQAAARLASNARALAAALSESGNHD